jgi:hypothetical protein
MKKQGILSHGELAVALGITRQRVQYLVSKCGMPTSSVADAKRFRAERILKAFGRLLESEPIT